MIGGQYDYEIRDTPV